MADLPARRDVAVGTRPCSRPMRSCAAPTGRPTSGIRGVCRRSSRSTPASATSTCRRSATSNDQSVNITDLDSANPILVRALEPGEGLDPYADQAVRFTRATLVRDGRLGPGLRAPGPRQLGAAPGRRLQPFADDRGARRLRRLLPHDRHGQLHLRHGPHARRVAAGLPNASFPNLQLTTMPFNSGVSGSTVPLAQPLILANSYACARRTSTSGV